ncbi:hypothetical protein M406DRAFT_65880 [Cryphonectria parasitica EP155]|uniref:T6SS Phospholipase effector Tle1-like catalytic domain-containing protein n=1 Tax=Cryphonectria parasitica (strain ATCC 38755 / EP155) TaxID=660469 RepID=A0A9P4XWC5_CRYP1|nr:uncharacterized protein M406DRAFT_65880 [Cryphonectria parasitica EP155]KAF3762113.1 hypothetical protein M406DRAFT_65880 [Cryphonectria parasitica EP155]
MTPSVISNVEFFASPRRIVLCFDGTGNRFEGAEKDTNIVKLYQMLLRDTPGQYHYYQRKSHETQLALGHMLDESPTKALLRFWSAAKPFFITTLDQAIGVSFEDHVLAGYKFIMRHYEKDDHIYIFGFSRGAYTARFLAEMVHEIGLLSKGNEEMVPFAWETFSNFQNSRGNEPQADKDKALRSYMVKFKAAFCRPGAAVHFLGLFDCVNSVGQFEIPRHRKSYRYMASPAARHIRHAVSIHERRLKFKPALFHVDKDGPPVDLKEVWFAGNHADVGGGWDLQHGQRHLLSDTPLFWMIQEVLNLPGSTRKLSFNSPYVVNIVESENKFPGKEEAETTAFEVRRRTNQPHDMLRRGGGVGLLYLMIITYNLCSSAELLPLFTRLELIRGRWIPVRYPPNLGAPRDLPLDAEIHPSVYEMIQAGILDKASIPDKGGDNPHLPNVASIRHQGKMLRQREA